jgi:hypothetical protein
LKTFLKLLGIFIFSWCHFLNSSVSASVQGILIPFYIYPTPCAIQPLLDARAQHPDVPMRVILNPATGPGTTQDPVYVAAIAALTEVGIETVGYVYTDYNQRPIADVMDDIATWASFYSPNGIFLDAMGTCASYYTDLSNYIYSLNMQFSIGNAGANVSTSYATEVNTVVIANSDTLPNLTDYSDWAELPATSSAMLLYGISPFPGGFLYQAKKISGWLYVTDGDLYFDALPSYFNLLMDALDTVDVGTIFPFYIYPTSSAIQELINTATQYPNVPIWVILDPANGPGNQIDPTYVSAIQQIRAAGIVILGYVNTNYGKRAKSLVEKDISTWVNFYGPDGIFLDLMAVNHPYYSSITDYAEGLGIQIVEGNPGTNISPSAGKDVDIVNIFENDFIPSPLSQFSDWYDLYPPSDLSIICYDVASLPTTFITEAAQYFGWIFVTDNDGSDPYDAYPSYFNSFIQLLSTL